MNDNDDGDDDEDDVKIGNKGNNESLCGDFTVTGSILRLRLYDYDYDGLY